MSVLATVLLFSSPSRGDSVLIYFYNPDANLGDMAKLKSEVQAYFQAIEPGATLKAFLRLQDLLTALKSQPPDFLVASSWVTKTYAGQYGLKPLLVGRVGAERAYAKVLISKKAVSPGATPSLSTVGLGAQNLDVLKSLVPDLRKFPSLNVVEVSKDLDAVLAVSFDQVDLGLVRSENIEAIRKVNQVAVANLKVLARSTPIEYPIFSATAKVQAPVADKFVKGLQATKGTQALDLMGFESWGAR
jgi:hypothetical protein